MTTNICFGGDDLATAYITASGTGRLLKTEWDAPGTPLNFLNRCQLFGKKSGNTRLVHNGGTCASTCKLPPYSTQHRATRLIRAGKMRHHLGRSNGDRLFLIRHGLS